jgi:dihydroorotate dehydrogenase electron transfer subunit
MTATLEIGAVRRSEDAAPGVGLLSIALPRIAQGYRPGAFVHLLTGADSVLRRPFSIARARGDEVVLLYRIVGGGTQWMRSRRFGDPVDAMGPLGRAFELRTAARRTLLVGGGLGIAPLLGLAEALATAGHAAPVEALLGIRTGGDVFGPTLTEGLDALALRWSIATDDGSAGFAGNVVQLLERRLDEIAASGERATDLALYAAGPERMLEATARLCLARGLDLQVSMEAHMGCGVGACRACGIVTWRDRSRINGRVCREGPVFDAREIQWEEVGA